MTNPKTVFNEIARKNTWGSVLSRSGPGSESEYCHGIIEGLPSVCRELEVKTLIDAPCGDLHWISPLLAELSIESYIGLDIADALEPEIRRNVADLGPTPSVEIRYIDIVSGPLPAGDLILIKDLLQHLSHERIVELLRTLAGSHIRFVLISNYYLERNAVDIDDGAVRYIDLSKAPFNFPLAMTRIEEPIEEPARWSRWYGLWSREQVQQAVKDMTT